MKLQLITYDDEETPESSEKPNFRVVDPAPNPKKKSPSIDAIIQRTHPSQRRTNSLVEIGIQDRFTALEKEELALQEKERDLVRLSAEIVERERVVRETEILLDARDRLLDDREAVLSARHGDDEDNSISMLEKSLEDTREALTMAKDALSEKESFIAGLRTELEELKTAPPVNEASPTDSPPNTFEAINHTSLADQVAFLREREAFIEESENTLFDKAQALQEWETRLQQNEHDQTASSSQAS